MPYRVENIVRKGEIACDKQFLLFSQCFTHLYIFSASNAALCGNGLKISVMSFSKGLTLHITVLSFNNSQEEANNKDVGKDTIYLY